MGLSSAMLGNFSELRFARKGHHKSSLGSSTIHKSHTRAQISEQKRTEKGRKGQMLYFFRERVGNIWESFGALFGRVQHFQKTEFRVEGFSKITVWDPQHFAKVKE